MNSVSCVDDKSDVTGSVFVNQNLLKEDSRANIENLNGLSLHVYLFACDK